jgi:hypothetical protein
MTLGDASGRRRVGRDGNQDLGGGFEQQVIDDRLPSR